MPREFKVRKGITQRAKVYNLSMRNVSVFAGVFILSLLVMATNFSFKGLFIFVVFNVMDYVVLTILSDLDLTGLRKKIFVRKIVIKINSIIPFK